MQPCSPRPRDAFLFSCTAVKRNRSGSEMSSASYYPSFLPSILSPVFLSFLNEWFSPNEDCRHRRSLALPFNEDLSFEKNGWRRQRQRQRRWRGRARSRQTDGKSNFQDSATQRTEGREGEGDIASHDKSFVAQRHLQLCAPHWMEEEGGEGRKPGGESRGWRAAARYHFSDSW